MRKKKAKELPVPNDSNIEKYIGGLNDDQVMAFYKMREFLYMVGPEMFLLKGYAGTGKTFLISRLIEYMNDNLSHFKKYNTMAAMTAPTNKAVQVLRESATKEVKDKVSFRTVHQLLGLKEVINDNGEIVFKNSTEDYNEITTYNVVIIDEVSMLNDELFYEIKNHSKYTKIIMMGDPCQIPPVGKVDCEPFLNPNDHGIIECTLSKIMRQEEGSTLVQASFHLREHVLVDMPIPEYVGKDLTMHTHPHQRSLTLNAFSDKFKGVGVNDFSQEVKVVAWRNKKVAEYNNYIRQLSTGMSGVMPKLLKGERMITNSPVIDGKAILLTTNQEFTIIDFSDQVLPFEDAHGMMDVRVYRVCAEYYDVELEQLARTTITIAHEDSEGLIKKTLLAIKNSALHAPDQKKKYFWKAYYQFQRNFADVSYAYAITAHKSQGSTYKNVIVDANDISLNQNVRERNRILYTAITRAKDHCLIIQ